MNNFTGMPFIRILPAFCLGIVLAFYHIANLEILFVFFSLTVAGFLYLQLRKKIIYKFRYILGFLLNIFFLSIGYALTWVKDCGSTEKYFTDPAQAEVFRTVIKNIRLAGNEKYRMTASVVQIYADKSWKTAKGNCYIYLPVDSISSSLEAGDELLLNDKPTNLSSPLNPGQFDFKKYAALQRIYFQFHPEHHQWCKIQREKCFSIQHVALKLRNRFLNIYKQAGITGQEYAVLSALVLGYDEEIDKSTSQSFSATGTLHVLSVSGMHVGIIFSALSGILFFMEKNKYLKIVRFVLLIFSLWFYALLTGLSPSVIRSAMMLSFILIGRSLDRSSSIYNSLGLAAFSIFIFFDPLLLFNAGMQLSFLAVWGIAFLYPEINKLIIPEYYLTGKIWSLVAVSLAAQAATLAISIFYFHRFPNYFILANLIIIPISTLCIFSGIGILFLNCIDGLVVPAGKIVYYLVHLLNESAEYIGRLPYSQLKNLSLSLPELFIFYVFLIAAFFWFEKKSIWYLYAALSLLNVFIFSVLVRTYFLFSQNTLLVYSGTSGFCCQRFIGFDSYLIFSQKDTAKAFLFSDSYQDAAGLSTCGRKAIILKSDCELLREGDIAIVKNRIVFGKYLVEINTNDIKRAADSIKEDLFFAGRIYSGKQLPLINCKEVIYSGNYTIKPESDTFRGVNFHNLYQGAKWISLK